MCRPHLSWTTVILLAVMNPISPSYAQAPPDCPEVCVSRWDAFRCRLRALFGRSSRHAGVPCKLPPAPRKVCPCEYSDGGMLLKTGSFQLGPGVGRDLLNSQNDGRGGF